MSSSCVSAEPSSLYVPLSVAVPFSSIGLVIPTVSRLGATFVTVTTTLSVPIPVSSSVTVRVTVYVPLSSGVKLKSSAVPLTIT